MILQRQWLRIIEVSEDLLLLWCMWSSYSRILDKGAAFIWNMSFSRLKKKSKRYSPWLLKLLLGCGMSHTCCWLMPITWLRLVSMGQGGVLLPQEVTAVPLATAKINNYPKGKSKQIIENHSTIYEDNHKVL